MSAAPSPLPVRDARNKTEEFNVSVRPQLRAVREAALLAIRGGAPAATWPYSPFAPFPMQVRRLLPDGVTESEAKMLSTLQRIGTGELQYREVYGDTLAARKYKITGSYAALSRVFKIDRRLCGRRLQRMVDKGLLRIFTKGNSTHRSTAYIVENFDEVWANLRRPDRALPPEKRIGVDPWGYVWHNGRADSKRFLNAVEFGHWQIDRITGQPPKAAEAAAAAAAPPQRSNAPTAVPHPGDVPQIVVDEIYAAIGPNDKESEIYQAALDQGRQIGVVLPDDIIAALVRSIGMAGKKTHREIGAPYLLTSMPGRAISAARIWKRDEPNRQAAFNRHVVTVLKSMNEPRPDLEAMREEDVKALTPQLGAELAKNHALEIQKRRLSDLAQTEEVDQRKLADLRALNPEAVLGCEERFREEQAAAEEKSRRRDERFFSGSDPTWDQIKRELKEQLSLDTYTNWVQRTVFEELRDGHLIVAAPNRQTAEWIESEYPAKILEIARTLGLKVTSVAFIVASHKRKPPPSTHSP